MIDNLIAGLVSGIIVVLLVLVFRTFWYRVIVPWFEERVYKDAKIEGQWFSLYPTTTDHRQEVITLNRHGHTVSGTMVCTSGDDAGEQYQISGSFRNLILPLVYESESTSKTDRGTITLKLVGNAQQFRGKVAAYYTPRDSVGSTDVIWFRSKAELDELVLRIEARSKQVQEIRQSEQEADAAKRQLTEGLKDDKGAEHEEQKPAHTPEPPQPQN